MAIKNITLEEADGHLSELVRQIKPGDEIVITENDQPKVKLTPVVKTKGKRVFGQHAGMVWMSDDFDAPLPDDFWFGSDIET
jgi:prevent-host-death family protein